MTKLCLTMTGSVIEALCRAAASGGESMARIVNQVHYHLDEPGAARLEPAAERASLGEKVRTSYSRPSRTGRPNLSTKTYRRIEFPGNFAFISAAPPHGVKYAGFPHAAEALRPSR